MSYNRWMPVQCSSELYHHGVKGMKWGRHLFGKGADIQMGPGGGGGGDLEEAELFEKLKELFGDKKALQYLERYKKGELDPGKIAQIGTPHGWQAWDRLEDSLSGRQAEMKGITSRLNYRQGGPNANKDSSSTGKSFYEQNKDKMHYKVGDMDTDARVRRYTAEGRDRYRQNGKYRNMNLTDVYGENSKVNGNVGKNGANLYKKLDVSDNRNGMNYATREQDKSKYNDGKYGFKDRVREKITGKMDPDYKKDAYNKKVSAAVRIANQKQAWSVGMEEADIRDKAKDYVDRLEKQVYNKSLAGAIERRRKKKRR